MSASVLIQSKPIRPLNDGQISSAPHADPNPDQLCYGPPNTHDLRFLSRTRRLPRRGKCLSQNAADHAGSVCGIPHHWPGSAGVAAASALHARHEPCGCRHCDRRPVRDRVAVAALGRRSGGHARRQTRCHPGPAGRSTFGRGLSVFAGFHRHAHSVPWLAAARPHPARLRRKPCHHRRAELGL